MPTRPAPLLRCAGRGVLSLLVLVLLIARPGLAQRLPPADTLALTLDDVVQLALDHSRAIENALLRRRADRYDLMVAQDRFIPDLILSSGLETSQEDTDVQGQGVTDLNADGLDFGATVSTLVPTGARLSVGWQGNGQWQRLSTPSAPASGRTIELLQGTQVRLEQPLLRGAGLRTTRAPLQIARAQDASSTQALRQTLMQVITNIILAYREVLRAQGQYEIAALALGQTQQTLDLNRRLVAAGRMGQIELVQSETEVANREVSLSIAANALEQAQLSLLQLLDLDRRLAIAPLDRPTVTQEPPPREALLEAAFTNRPEYHQARDNLFIGRLSQTLARNNTLWAVDAVAEYTKFFNDEAWENTFGFGGQPLVLQEGWRLGLNVRYTLGDRTRRQQLEQSRLQLTILENRLADLEEQIRIEVEGALRNAELRRQQVDLAQRARELSEQQLAVEEEKLSTGRSSNFQVLTYQNNLVNARVAELDAIIAYLNALTRLDLTVGTTLDTWNARPETF